MPTDLHRVIEANRYMTLATADGEGRPWASPVWYAHEACTEFFWVSRPDVRHSRNIATRASVAIVIFDSTVPVGDAEAVYLEAEAHQLDGDEAGRGIEIFTRRSVGDGAGEWTVDDVSASAPHRLYRAVASTRFVLDANERRTPVS